MMRVLMSSDVNMLSLIVSSLLERSVSPPGQTKPLEVPDKNEDENNEETVTCTWHLL